MHVRTVYLLVGEVTQDDAVGCCYLSEPIGLTDRERTACDLGMGALKRGEWKRVYIYGWSADARLDLLTVLTPDTDPFTAILYAEGEHPHHRAALLSLLHQLHLDETAGTDEDDVCELTADPPVDPTTARAGDCPTAPAAEVECNDPMCSACGVRRHQTDPPMRLCRPCYDTFSARYTRPTT